MHAMHAAVASAEYLPSAQRSQLLAPPLASVFVTDPALQFAHSFVGSADHWPAAHGTHFDLPTFGTDPTPQISQLDESA